MAKFGNFVGKEDVPFTEQEEKAFTDLFTQLIVEHEDNKKVGFKYENTVQTPGSFGVSFMVDEPINKRDCKKNRIINFKGITFIVRKHKGYLDITDWSKDKEIVKDYENTPEFQYAVYIVCHGHIIRYKCRNMYYWELKEHFQYDTEIESFTFKTAIRELFNSLT